MNVRLVFLFIKSLLRRLPPGHGVEMRYNGSKKERTITDIITGPRLEFQSVLFSLFSFYISALLLFFLVSLACITTTNLFLFLLKGIQS